MPNSYLAPYVICPFYRYDKENQIVCESPVDTALSCMINFQTISDARGYIQDFCSTKCYEGCPMYQAIMIKYTPEE